ncbi:alkaline phosphatase D family protein [Nocardioides nanhaiensis]|uniref:alkaline phosphatase D family protein n=1 Tax=Nocardioides nanhaiensis TaxID=1476871 RepID=UPI0031EB0678
MGQLGQPVLHLRRRGASAVPPSPYSRGGVLEERGHRLGRRSALAAGLALGAAPGLVAARLAGGTPTFLRERDHLVAGTRTGEVTTDSAVVWARTPRDGRLQVRLSSGGRVLRRVRGPWTDRRADGTARVQLAGLAPGRDYEATVWFAAPDGSETTRDRVTFRTAPVHEAAQSFVWSGDTCGQGWGINPELGGLTTYRAMLATRPDFFIHSGDTIYADEPMEETVLEASGDVWRNQLTEAVTKVAETLEDFRGRHRYPLLDEHVRALYSEVPTIAQWDDHETVNNWYPGELHDDERYRERRVDVLARRARRAWQEYQPVPVRRLVGDDGSGFAPGRIYRRVPRGRHLDVFCLDMRSYRGANPDSAEGPTGILGPAQERWLVESLAASRATWKVVSADLPLSIPSHHDDDLDGPSNGIDGAPRGREHELARVLAALQVRGVRNVVWLTADVHYTAAHHYHPDRAAFTDFHPFWEFVSGPLAGGTFGRKDDVLDRTFGPQVAFSRGNDRMPVPMSPRAGRQFFGHVAIAATGELTVTLHDSSGASLWRTTLEPEEQRGIGSPRR